MIWDYDSLWQKAKKYVDRAYAEDREGPWFAFWASLALEFLARATLAKVHPALLASPNDPDNLLFAFGLSATNKPKSIEVTTVYLRCSKIEPEFTPEISSACATITERRNSELHSGDLAFDNLSTGIWLPHFYKASAILLKNQGKSLSDFLPTVEEAAAAQQMIDGLEKSYRDDAKRAIGQAKGAFGKLSPEEQKTRRQFAEQQIANLR